MRQKRYLYRLLLLCPLLFGLIGFLAVDHISFLDALFNTVQMYVLNYGGTPTNVWVELARWTAPLATAGSILMLLAAVNQYIRARLKKVFTDSVAVYGPEEEAERLLSQLGSRGIRGKDKFLPAHRYILLGNREENFAFYETHRRDLQDSQVYIRCDSLPAQSVAPFNVHLFNPEEIAARLFWKNDELLSAAMQKDGRLNIVFLGFGKIGEDLLYWGMQDNIFLPGQKISYHIFGDASGFLSAHPMLEQITDPVVTYEDAWQDHLTLLNDADMIIVLSEGLAIPQESTVYQLLSLVPRKKITVFSALPSMLSMLDEQERLYIIDISAQTLDASHILENDLIANAMKVNLRYAHLYNKVDETEENAQIEWEKLSTFLRYSNISTADYHEIRQLMMRRMGVNIDGSGLTAEQKEFLSELEHIRWCRYHWLNNWHYGIPENGEAKDAALRIHTDLVPYAELSEEEKEKDRMTIDVMLGLYNYKTDKYMKTGDKICKTKS